MQKNKQTNHLMSFAIFVIFFISFQSIEKKNHFLYILDEHLNEQQIDLMNPIHISINEFHNLNNKLS